MVADVGYLLAQLAILGFGAGAAFHPSVRTMSVAARAAVSLAAGAVALTLEATLFSTLALPWSVAGLAAPLGCLSLWLGWMWSRRHAAPRPDWSGSAWVAGIAGFCCLAAVGFLGVSFFSSAATSVDFLFFWGVKAARFAAARGIDANFLRSLFSYHAVPDYPPLVPVVDAWGSLIAGRLPWRLVPILSAGWLAATIPVVFERCRRLLPDNAAAALTAFWTCALSVSLAYSCSGGNAEAPLLFFETIAVVWLLTEREANESRFVPALALCGAALTKVEGSLAVICLVLGMACVEPGWHRRLCRSLALGLAPAAGVAVWFLYQRSKALPIGYRSHGKLLDLHLDHLGPILAGMLRFLNAGSLWLAWLVPLGMLLERRSGWKRAAPALGLTAGILFFLVYDYLHDSDLPRIRIEWTLPRVSQPALSALILAAGLASLRREETRAADRTQAD